VAERRADLGVAIVDQDSYYQDLGNLSAEARSSINYDDPSALDHDLLFQHFERLTQGQVVEKPRYSFATHTRTPEVDRVSPAPLIILEGLYALWDARLRALMGLKIYLAADPDIRLIRRLRRDLLERGRNVESVVAQYLSSVRPMHRFHVEPTKAHADLVLDTTDGPLEVSVEAVDRALARALES
jgi:uridine kinase